MKKRIVSSLVSLCLVLTMTVTVFASYEFNFTPPYSGSMQYSIDKVIPANSDPHVNPSHSTTPTNYFIGTGPKSSIARASSRVEYVSTSGKRSFTYRAGYGGYNSIVYLAGYPSYPDFTDYDINGTWAP